MLILSRRIGESLQIGEDVNVRVLSVNDDQIKLGIDAPQNVGVYREKIYQKIQAEKIR